MEEMSGEPAEEPESTSQARAADEQPCPDGPAMEVDSSQAAPDASSHGQARRRFVSTQHHLFC